MPEVTLGSTGITVEKNGFGALPIQRISRDAAAVLLKKAYTHGISFFDTARFYTDSEEKVGYALHDVRENIFIATKTGAQDADTFYRDLETSLSFLQTDYIDIYQFHNPAFCPKPGDGTGLYEAMEKMKREGVVRHIGITNHRLSVAREAIASGLYETLQFPFSYLSGSEELDLVERCQKANMGFIAMKALAGGLITHAEAAYAYLGQFENVLPIWGIQREKELDDFLAFIPEPAKMTEEIQAFIQKEKQALSGDFCRGCGYCMPCPAGIEIHTCARMSLLIRRSPSELQLTPEVQAKMMKIKDCLHCGNCAKRCPYGLDTPRLLADNLKDYEEILAGKAY